MDFERILQMAANERNLALLHDEALVDDISEFLAIRQLYNAAIKQVSSFGAQTLRHYMLSPNEFCTIEVALEKWLF